MPKKTYILRVYDQTITSDIKNNTAKLNGIVEDVDTGIKHTFHSKNELWKFISGYKEQVVGQPVKSDLIK